MIEIWRAVVGYKGLYEVSNWGRVKRLAGKGCRQERILKPQKRNNGYLAVILYKEGKMKSFLVHRLVGIAFADMVEWTDKAKGKPFEELQINHKKEKEKTNNHVSNLEWCDCKYNNNYGTHNESVAKALSKPVYQKTLNGEFVREWFSATEVERQTGYDQGNISACCLGKRQQAYGSLWSYTKL